MGMYDSIEFRYRMPDGYEGRSYQSKSLDCTADEYVVTPEGRLHRRYSSGYPNEVRQPLGDIAFDGELNVYASGFGDVDWHEYDLMFVQGNLTKIRCHQTDAQLVFEPAETPATPAISGPEKGRMEVFCPWCGARAQVDMSACIQMGADCRPVDCDSCGKSYELRLNGERLKLATGRNAAGNLQEYYVTEAN